MKTDRHPDQSGAKRNFPLDGWLFAVLIILLNAPLLWGHVPRQLVFVSSAVAGGEIWRVLTHPFVHVSSYHLLLDTSAFLALYGMLGKFSLARRLQCAGACAAGSLLAALLVTPNLAQGFCGLSGVAHGLMAVVVLDLIQDQKQDVWLRRTGLCCLLILVSKSIFEATTGHVIFSSLHLFSVGAPIAACHAGGVLAGILWYSASRQLCPKNGFAVRSSISAFPAQKCAHRAHSTSQNYVASATRSAW